MLNGTIIGVSCCLLRQGELMGQGQGCCGKGGPLSHSHAKMKETQETYPNTLSLPPGLPLSWNPAWEVFLTPGPGPLPAFTFLLLQRGALMSL